MAAPSQKEGGELSGGHSTPLSAEFGAHIRGIFPCDAMDVGGAEAAAEATISPRNISSNNAVSLEGERRSGNMSVFTMRLLMTARGNDSKGRTIRLWWK